MKHALLAALAPLTLLIAQTPSRSADELLGQVNELVRQVTPSVVEWRRDFHAHPELSHREERTAKVVAEQLRAMGIEEIKTGVGGHGVVALVRGKRPGPTVALRGDMDALPVQEQTGLPFASKTPGVMHACGHDAHTAMLLGAARVLVQLRDVLPGTVKLVFQPAEESSPEDGGGGAKGMIEAGVLRGPDVAAIFGLHVGSELPTGKIGYRFGSLMAGVDHFKVTVVGKQSHAAMPWQGIDPIVASAHVITAIQTIPSRHIDARQPVVVSVGVVQAGTAWNIIPERAKLEGTLRTLDPEVRKKVVVEFRRIVEQTAIAHGAKAEIVFGDYGPPVWNDPALGKQARQSLARAAGETNVIEVPPVMGGEDFAHFAQKVPGFFAFLGVRNETLGAVHGAHSPRFMLDEAALPVGVRALVLMAADYLLAERRPAVPGRPGSP
jgi:amidohydrolase